ncbi:MAG: urease accessory UreF family protein [Burkholderiaceae bacterium]
MPPDRPLEATGPGVGTGVGSTRSGAPSGAALLSLLRLASPALPIGGFSYSQGFETAVERGWIRNEADAGGWIEDLLDAGIGRFDAPICLSIARAIANGRDAAAFDLHRRFLASRETRELRAETEQMGYSLLKLLDGLDGADAHVTATVRALRERSEPCGLPLAWALAARSFGVPPDAALHGYLWAWLENQVMAALKAVPLGQQAGQRLFARLIPRLAEVIEGCEAMAPEAWSNFAPGFALASSWHETQYSRLFRS